MKYCTNCVSPSSAPLLGKTSSNGCYYALRQNKNIISASNSSPSHSLTLESFAQVKTCNQFISNIPDLVRIVEEMKHTKEPRILKRGSSPVAMLMPMETATQRHKTIEPFDF